MRNYLGEKVLDNSIEGFQLIGFDWKYIYVNTTVAKQAKKTKKSLLGKTMMEQFPGIENTKMFATLKDSMENRVRNELENKFLYPDGTKAWFQLIIEPVPEGIFILSLDITEKMRAEKMLFEINRSLEKKVLQRTSELRRKNNDITDSINYAKRIQKAMLVPKETIYQQFSDCFILLKPKDIVSGDFYYFKSTPKYTYLAAVDCTGHGVPGALMSMLCYEKLNDTLIKDTEPSKVLSQVNKKIKSSLNHSERKVQTHDGMDISFCRIDENNRLQFSGANRPLWIIRKGKKEVEEIKGDRISVGGITPTRQKYQQQTVQLNKGDCFYLFSDGYSDMFGGPKEKKFMTKRFKELLLKIRSKPMDKQKAYLADFVDEWRGDLEQIDDILVIGVRI